MTLTIITAILNHNSMFCKAEAFANTLERQFQENKRSWTDVPDDQPIQHVTWKELQEILRHPNIRKAPEWDEIEKTVLRKLSKLGIAALLNTVKAILRLRHFPAD